VTLDELLYRQDRGDLFVLFDVDQVDDRFAAAVAVSLRKLVDLCPVDLAVRCEEQKQCVAACNKNILDVVVFLRIYRVDAFAAAFLLAVEVKRSAFDVVFGREGNDHVVICDKVFDVDVPS